MRHAAASLAQRTAATAAALVVAIAAFGAAPARAQSYPAKPVRIIVPSATGGGSDTLARTLAERLSRIWAQPVYVENRTGAGIMVGAEAAAKSPADGYTMLLVDSGHVVVPSLVAKPPYDAIEDFSAVTQLTSVPMVIVVDPSLKVQSLAEFIALLKANPGKYNYGSGGHGGVLYLSAGLFKSLTKVDIVHVPYKGSNPALTAVIAGEVQMLFPTAISARAHIESNRVRGLAVASSSRLRILPGTPTAAEAGLPEWDAAIWYGVVVPNRTPAPIVAKLNADLVAVIQEPEVRNRLAAQGIEVQTGTPAQFDQLMRKDAVRWGRIVRDAGIKIEY